MNNLQLFLTPNHQNNILLVSGDAYTLSGNAICSEQSKRYSEYYFANRYNAANVWPDVAQDSRMCLYGLSHFIKANLTKPFTRNDVNEAVCFMSQAHIGGGPLPFDRNLLDWCVEKNNGYLPLRIRALREGSTFFPNEPVIVVESPLPHFGELAAHIEGVFTGQVSIATARVTLVRHWLDRLCEWFKVEKNNENYSKLQFMIHDFGMRASSCAEESEMLGMAHLLVFNGTDTFNAAYQAWRCGAKPETGKSILALAHRIVQGFHTEEECFKKLSDVSSIGSYVSDCYKYATAVDRLVQLAKDNPNKIYVCRPDSGSHIDNLNYFLDRLVENDLVTKNLRYLDGDSVNPKLMKELIDICWSRNINPLDVFATFGIGGYLRNSCTRDTLSSSYKLGCVAGDEPVTHRSVVKLSEVIGKMSVPSPNFVTRDFVNGYTVNYGHSIKDNRGLFYDGLAQTNEGRFTELCYEQFSTIQDRVINQFADMGKMPKNYGMPENTCLSPDIIKIQQQYKEQYRS